MAIAKRTPLYLQCLLLAGSISLAACGGDGSSSPKDTTPDAIAFTASTNAATSAAVTSPAVTVSGIDAEASVSISGGEYSINGGAFTSAAGKISNGQSLVVRVTASDKTNTAKSATITVGGVSATFSVTTLADVTPASFTLAPVTNAALGATVTSAAVTLSGFDIAVPVSITGGEYSINGGDFTSAAGTVSAAQSVAVKLVASANHSTTTTAQLTVGGVSAGFSVTTLPDSTPDAFSFTAKTGAAINTAYTSDAVTVKGIDTAVAISITGGEYSVNSGAFTAAAGTVSVNDTVSVKATAANGTELTHNAVLTIGDVTGTYAITTVLDTTAPVAEFKFPTPYTMSEANSVKVRGTAIDEHGITGVKLVIGTTEIEATPKSETNGVKDFSSWTATISLTANAENEIKVIATDDRSNATLLANANKVTVRQADVAEAFPDETNQFDFFDSSALINVDGRDQLLVLDIDKIWKVDLATGLRSIFVDYTAICSGTMSSLSIDIPASKIYTYCDQDIFELSSINGSFLASYPIVSDINRFSNLVLDKDRNQLVFGERTSRNAAPNVGGKLIAFSLITKQFSNISIADQDTLVRSAADILVDSDRYLVTTGGQASDATTHKIISVDVKTGIHNNFTDNTINNGELFSSLLSNGNTAFLKNIIKDSKNNRIFVNESLSNKIFSIDPSSGDRELFKNIAYIDSNDIDTYPLDIDLNESADHLLISDVRRKAILIVDLETKEKVILSKSKNDF